MTTIKKTQWTITSETIHTVISNLPRLTNLNRAFEIMQTGKNKPNSDWKEVGQDLLFAQRAISNSTEQREAKAIAGIDVQKHLGMIADILGIKQIILGKELSYSRKGDILQIDPQGAMAIAIMHRYMEKDLIAAAKIITNLIKSDAMDARIFEHQNESATAYLFMHLAKKGVDGALCDIYLSDKTIMELNKSQITTTDKFFNSLRILQFNYINAVLEGDDATFYEY